MNWVDAIIVVVVVLSAIIGLLRGFIREVVALASWFAAFILAFEFAGLIAPHLQEWIHDGVARMVIGGAIVFFAVLIVGAIINYLLGRLIDQTGFAGTDRLLGIVFGTVRGVAILIVLVMLAGATSLPREAWWRQSMFTGQLERGALWVRGYLPAKIADTISYPDRAPAKPDDGTLAKGQPS